MQNSLTHRRVRQLDRKRRTRPCATAVSAVRRSARRGARARLTQPWHTMPADRRGSTLMIVIVLLGLLSVLGVLFYTFAAAERSNAEYYASGAKAEEQPGLPADVLMDFTLQQLIVGTDPRYKNSALWGSRHSMLANMLGVKNHRISDLAAFDGTGVNVINDASGVPTVDQNYDGTGEGTTLLEINQSPAAHRLVENNLDTLPQPDVGYTYPDINNLFLAHVGWTRIRGTETVRRVIIPSFHRPQLNRELVGGTGTPEPLWEDRNYNGTLDAGEDLNGNGALDPDPASNYTNDTFKTRLLRPHPGHVYVPPSVQGATQQPRFIYSRTTAAAVFGDGKHVFPFFPMYDGYQPTDSGTDITYTSRPAEWIGHQGVWSTSHPSGATYNDEYQYDVDNDGDGIREGIWLDLDYPVQELADGTTYIPLFSITVYDQNGLFDLNSHGNIQELLFTYPNTPFASNSAANQPFGYNSVTGRTEFISASNLGVMPSEVNFAWGLTGRPGLEVTQANIPTVFSQYQLFFANLPYDASTYATAAEQTQLKAWQEVANMELAFLKMGRPEINSGSGSLDNLFPGVYGEEHLIAQNLGTAGNRDPRAYPHPGTSVIDDNNDLNEGMQTPPRNDGGATPTWLDVEQPFDMLGIGSFLAGGNQPKGIDCVNPPSPMSRITWPRYTNYAGNGNVFWGSGNIAGGGLMLNSQAYGLFDDPAELALYANDQRDVDDPLSAEDAAFLAMSNDDITNLGVTSRLQQLAKFNFSTDQSTNLRGEEIRKRFTTVSNDRKNFSVPRQSGTGGRNWEWTDDQGNNTSQSNSRLRFPPTFGPAGSAIQRYSTTDPFRPAVRYLLQATREDLQVTKQYQQRLSVNQLLTYNNQSKKLEYRELTLHPLDPGSAQIVPTTVYPPQTAAQQEFWARKDRQQLARDIYVLLYLLGRGPDGDMATNAIRTPGTTLYTTEQLEQMARFAVNLVDAQDRDNVITRFEYDKDLSNGWNLDDDPYSIDASTDRAEVWGVERQELTFSEVLVFRTAASASNSPHTAHDDMNERQFAYVELRNVAPYDIKFTNKEAWQIVMKQVEPGDAAYVPATDALRERRLSLRGNAGYVPRSGFYTIFSTDQNEPATNPSAFRADPTASGAPIWIAPRDDLTFATSANATSSHIDLVEDSATMGDGFRLTNGDTTPLDLTNTAGGLLNDGSGTPGAFALNNTDGVRFVLRRRAHPTRSRPTGAIEEQDNPYVEVDRMEQDGPMPDFDLGMMAVTAATIQGELANLVSRERAEPLAATSVGDNDQSDGNYRYNTFDSITAAENSISTAGQFLYKQTTHFDRDFMSLGELLYLPVVGPPPYDNTPTDSDPDPWDGVAASPRRDDGVTRYFDVMWNPPVNQYGIPMTPTTYRFTNYAKTAHAMFAVPNHPVLGDPANIDSEDNRWHRVLEFLEVPTRMHRNLGLGDEFDIARVPGKVNLNTVRHPEVLGGLIDDENLVELDLIHPDVLPTPTTSVNDSNYPHLNDDTGEAAREWYEQFQNSRDARDMYWFTAGGQDLRLPGTPGSRPFRGFAFSDAGSNSFQYTLLRELPLDNGEPSLRHIFEVGDQSEHQNSTLDPILRHRILSKIWSNTTPRSNSFVVFISAKLFRAHVDTTTGAVQIGGPLKEFSATVPSPELPEYRGVFVVDRSDLEAGGQAGGTGLTSFQPYVKYRKILKEE